MSTLPRPCLGCQAVVADSSNRCAECQAVETRRRDALPSKRASRAAYGNRWRRLSERVRRQVGSCEECGRRDDLTLDHSAEAHRRQSRGFAVRMIDVRVLCRPCNAKAGRARP